MQELPLQKAIVEAWEELADVDRSVLATEMARSAILGQSFERTPLDAGGPAFLVYYSPAFVRKGASNSPHDALRILAEVYRQSRYVTTGRSEDLLDYA